MTSNTVSRPPTSPAADRRLALIAIALLLAARLAFLLGAGLVYDDAYISLRYASNLAAGSGLLYNPGEWVYGASTPLYTLLLAAFAVLDLPALWAARVLAIFADAATLFLWLRWLDKRYPGAWAAAAFALFFGLTPMLSEVAVSGMETSFFVLLMTISMQGAVAPAGRPRATEALWGLALALTSLARLEGVLLAGLLLLVRRRVTGVWPWMPGAIVLCASTGWVLFSWSLYGSPLPHSIGAKAAAYNIHRPSILPNLLDLSAQLAPIRGPIGRLILNTVLLIGLVAAAARWQRDLPLRLTLLLLAGWLLYLITPRTLLFKWYYPPVLLLAHLAAAMGVAAIAASAAASGRRPRFAAGMLAALACGGLAWTAHSFAVSRQLASAETDVRRKIGLWLRDHSSPTDIVAAEPIGYIGYFSGRLILDEVGLVSPSMVSLNRAGDGWFEEMIRLRKPDIVVERPHYLLRNRTLNSGLRLWRTPEARTRFASEYQLVRLFQSHRLPQQYQRDYRFGIYARRAGAASRSQASALLALPEERRERAVDERLVRPRLTDRAAALSLARPRPR